MLWGARVEVVEKVMVAEKRALVSVALKQMRQLIQSSEVAIFYWIIGLICFIASDAKALFSAAMTFSTTSTLALQVMHVAIGR